MLIPKKEGAKDMREFRLESVLHVIEGRKILEIMFVANEVESMLVVLCASWILKMQIEMIGDWTM